MAWEIRKGRPYYYRKRWVDGTCKSEYVGSGADADCIAHQQETDSRQATIDREMRRAEYEVDRRVGEVLGEIRILHDAVMVGSGYYQHKREWRKSQ